MKSKKISLIAITVFLILILCSCSSKSKHKFDINVSTEELQPIVLTLPDDSEPTLSYQGYINIDTLLDKEEGETITNLIIEDIKIAENKYGNPVIYRYNKPLTEQTLPIIYNNTKQGNIYPKYEYDKESFKNYGFSYFQSFEEEKYVTKLHYIIMGVDPTVIKTHLQRQVKFKIVYEFEDGNIVEKDIEVNIP